MQVQSERLNSAGGFVCPPQIQTKAGNLKQNNSPESGIDPSCDSDCFSTVYLGC